MKKVLFILKRKENYGTKDHGHIGLSTGLYNSASFVHQMLLDSGIESHLQVVIDNNDIDRYVTKYRPTHVIVEALWVVPTKFAVLCKLHPNVKWIIRIHSEVPFLANEGIAFDWIGDYMCFKNIILGINSPRAFQEIRQFIKIAKGWDDNQLAERIIYLPNFYPQEYYTKDYSYLEEKETIDIGCFGAVRPLKNHLLQAIAAVEFAESINKKLRFHINSGRVEMKGEPVVNNLKGFFSHIYEKGHYLVNHEWTPRESFLKLCSTMDIGLQVSFSETFNIVGADLISQGVPIVGSIEIPWSVNIYNADPTSLTSIFNKLNLTYLHISSNVSSNQHSLTEYTDMTREIWEEYFLDR